MKPYKPLFKEVISSSEYKQNYKPVIDKTFDKSLWEKAFPQLKDLFMKLNNNKFKPTLIFDLRNHISAEKTTNPAVDLDIKKILNYMKYTYSHETYPIGLCEKDGNIEKIINVIKKFLQIIKESQDKQNYIDKIKRKIQATKDNKSGKQTINIEELEKEIKDWEEKKLFYDNVIGSAEEYLSYTKQLIGDYKLVFTISRRKITSQSTKVDWGSCMSFDKNPTGVNNTHFIGSSMSDGTFIVFLTKLGDEISLKAPLARVLVKPYRNDSDEIFWYVDKVYPIGKYSKFRQAVVSILSDENMKLKNSTFRIDTNVHYRDSREEINLNDVYRYVQNGDFSDITSKPKEFIEEMFKEHSREIISNWDFNIPFPDIEIETLDVSDTDIRELPKGIKFKNLNISNTNISFIG